MTLESLKSELETKHNRQTLFRIFVSEITQPHMFSTINALHTLLYLPNPQYEYTALTSTLTEYLNNFFRCFCTKEIEDQMYKRISSLIIDIRKPDFETRYEIDTLMYQTQYPLTPEIKERIKDLKKKSGLSIKNFSKYCNLPPNNIFNLLDDHIGDHITKKERDESLEKLSCYLNIPLPDLLLMYKPAPKDAYEKRYPITNITRDIIRERIQEAVDKSGLSIKEFSRKIGVNKNVIESFLSYNTPRKFIELRTAYLIAEHNDCTLDYILCLSDNPEEFSNGKKNPITRNYAHNVYSYICTLLNNSKYKELYLLCFIGFLLLPESSSIPFRLIINACAKIHSNYRYSFRRFSEEITDDLSPEDLYNNACSWQYEYKAYENAASLYYLAYATSLDTDPLIARKSLVSLGSMIQYFKSKNREIIKDADEILEKYNKLLNSYNEKAEV